MQIVHLFIFLSQMKEFIALTDILDRVKASDSECDVLSSGDKLDAEDEL